MSAGPEDDLLVAVTDALGYRAVFHPGDVWQHVRRSDRAIVQGVAGLPDILGVIGSTLIAWELKAQGNALRPDQVRWTSALDRVDRVDVRTVHPKDVDGLVLDLLGDRLVGRWLRVPRG